MSRGPETRTGQKRRLPVSSWRYSLWLTEPAKTHWRGAVMTLRS